MDPRHIIPTVDKAVRLVHTLAEGAGEPTAGQLARKLSISPSTCYRILQTLSAHGWLRVTPGGSYVFSTGILPLLRPLSDYQRLFEHLGHPLDRLVEETGLTAKLSLKQGERAVTVYRVESPQGLAPNSKTGATFPLAYGSSGACLLAGLDDEEVVRLLRSSPKEVWRLQTEEDVWKRIVAVRKERCCYDPGQFRAPVHAVSSPVVSPEGGIFAAATLVGWAEDFQGTKLRKLKERISAAALACSQALASKAGSAAKAA